MVFNYAKVKYENVIKYLERKGITDASQLSVRNISSLIKDIFSY